MQDIVTLASTLASVIALITLAKMSRDLDQVQTLLSALAKNQGEHFRQLRERLNRGKDEPPLSSDDIQWKV